MGMSVGSSKTSVYLQSNTIQATQSEILRAMLVLSAVTWNVVLSLAAGISMLTVQFYLLTVQGEKRY